MITSPMYHGVWAFAQCFVGGFRYDRYDRIVPSGENNRDHNGLNSALNDCMTGEAVFALRDNDYVALFTNSGMGPMATGE